MGQNLTKSQLEQNRIDNIYTNGIGAISASMLSTFQDNFITSIYTYTDNKWGSLEVNGSAIRSVNTTQTSIGLTTQLDFLSPTDINLLATDDVSLTSSAGNINLSAFTNLAFNAETSNTFTAQNFQFTINSGIPVNRLLMNITKVSIIGDTEILSNGNLDFPAAAQKVIMTNWEQRRNATLPSTFNIHRADTTPIQVVAFEPKGLLTVTDFDNVDSESTLALGRKTEDGAHYEILDIFNNGYSDSDYCGLRQISGGAGIRRPFVIDSVDHNLPTWAEQYNLWLRINPNGNVGVGRVPGDFKLDVDGTGLFRETLTTYGSLGVGEEPSVDLHITNYASAAYIRAQGVGDGDNYSALELRDNANTSIWQFRNRQSDKAFAFGHNNGTSWSAPLTLFSNGNATFTAPIFTVNGGYINSENGYRSNGQIGYTGAVGYTDDLGAVKTMNFSGGILISIT